MVRTNQGAVKAVLSREYDWRRSTLQGGPPDLAPYIEAASSVVDDLTQAALLKCPPVTLTKAKLELIERWLAAHFYQTSDPGFTSKSTNGASGSLNGGGTGEGFESTRFGLMAIRIDPSNCLRNLDKNQVVTGFSIGRRRCWNNGYSVSGECP